MPPKNKKPNKEYAEDFFNLWNLGGGLLIAKEVGKILNVSEGHISKKWKQLNLEKINIQGKEYFTFQSLYKEYKRRSET